MNPRYSIPVISLLCLALLLAGCANPTSTTSQSTSTSPVSPESSHAAEPVEIVSVIGPEPPINPGGPSVTITLYCVSDEPIVTLRATLELNRSYEFDFPASASSPISRGDTAARGMTLINAGFSDDAAYPLTISGTFADGWTFSFTKEVYITPRTTQTPVTTLDGEAVTDYLDSASECYRNGISCSGGNLEPDLDIDEASFLSLRIIGDGVLQIDDTPYYYAAIPDYLGYIRGTVELPGYTVSFTDPEPGVTRTGGGMAVVVHISREGVPAGEEDYYDTVFNLFNKSVGVKSMDIEQVRVLSFFYKPDCENMEKMTLILVPVPPQ